MVDPNTRQGKRTPVTLKIKFKSETLEQFIERYAVDVSQGGIFIRTKEPLAVGTQMRFEFQLRDASPLIAGEGTVVWTRENDPSRPAIAPGMGVRFDRLAEGSQAVLERILSEKAKQAPQRAANESTKPPLFTDTPTKVAPLPVQEALLDRRRAPGESFNDQHTPLPKPMPFHSDAEDFDEQAFEEATKVRALDELIAQTAEGDNTATAAIPPDELAARRSAGLRADSTVADPPQEAAARAGSGPVGVAKSTPADRESAPGLPSPPSPGSAPRVDPRVEEPGELGKTKLGFDAPRSASTSTPPPERGRDRDNKTTTPPKPSAALKDAPTQPTGMQAVVATGVDAPSAPAKRPAAPAAAKSSAVPAIILLLVLIAAAGAGVWFFYLRPKAEQAAKDDQPKPGTGTALATNPQVSDAAPVAPTVDAAPAGPIVETVIAASNSKATVEIVGTDQKGAVPFTAKLEKDKEYKARVSAPGFATLELDVKGGDDKVTAKLVPKPRVISVTTDPPGALIFVDNAATGHTTPHEVELTNAQAAKSRVKVTMRKGGYRQLDKIVAADAFKETDGRMEAEIDAKLAVAVRRPPPDRGTTTPDAGGAGTGAGTGATQPDAGTSGTGTGTGAGTGAGTGSPTPTPTPTPTPKPTPPTTTPPTGAGTAAPPKEPEPGFVNP